MRKHILAYSLIIFILLIDQLSKWLVIEGIFKSELGQPGVGLDIWLTKIPQPPLGFVQMKITEFFNLVMVWNKGVNYFMPGDLQADPIIMAALASLLTLALLIWMIRSKQPFIILPLAAIIGGAISNIWDRIRFGGVADFLDFHAFGWHWPAFNVADASIVIGVAVILVDGVILEPLRAKRLTTQEPT